MSGSSSIWNFLKKKETKERDSNTSKNTNSKVLEKHEPEELIEENSDVIYREKVTQIKLIFDLMDTDHDGKINRSDLVKAMCDLELNEEDVKLGETQIKKKLSVLEIHEETSIDFPTFLKAVEKFKLCETESQIKDTFKYFDKDQNGNISPQELKTAMFELNIELTESQIKQMIDVVDENRDGVVDINEFKKLYQLYTKSAKEDC